MAQKSSVIKNEIAQKCKNDNINTLIERKFNFFKDVIQKTIIRVQKNKILDILGISDVGNCIDRLGELSKKISEFSEIKNKNNETLINGLQFINNELSSLFKNYGTESLEDLISICFGNNNKIPTDEKDIDKYDLLKKYFHPTSYKLVNIVDDTKNKKNEEEPDDIINNLQCNDVWMNCKQFHMKVYGMKVYIHSSVLKKSLIIFGTVDDVIIEFLNNKYIKLKQQKILDNKPKDNTFNSDDFNRFMTSLLLKDYFICENHKDIYNKFVGCISENNSIIKQKQIAQVVKEFIVDDMYKKRNTVINLLIQSSNYENQYLAYLLYDLLSNDSNGNIDTQEQIILFDSLPWSFKQYFKQAMKKTIQYTNDLSNFDINKIPLEQQICLLQASDTVKEKAMIKLKEVKAKSEDSGSKARQYLDGLLKIPFNVYKREPILNIMNNVRNQFKEMCHQVNKEKLLDNIPNKESYTSIEILNYIKKLKNQANTKDNNLYIDIIKEKIIIGDKKKLIHNIILINEILNKHKLEQNKIHSLTKEQLKIKIELFISLCKKNENKNIMEDTIETFSNIPSNNIIEISSTINKTITSINNEMNKIKDYMTNVKLTLDNAVHGHDKAKKQIERIIGQWLTGKQDGYCFGFEGPPGIGKTTLAKRGLADCLKDENGNSRPFAMIQMGGDSNGSTLHGHNYTYVGSTWGSIVQILIDKKCMNPIIFIDEVDKISRTEHGKEIVGILTHLLDPAQNDCFQDKYFTGVDIDLSKALFILSYNDVEVIDKILLDRVHRIKFTSLSLEDKLIICNTHILPEIYSKMGLQEMITFSDEVLKFIIDEYTLESGVRKLKEILFEIIGEINLNVLKLEKDYDYPIDITINDIKMNYFKDKREVKIYKIHNESKVGVINALWANQLSQGGVLPLQASFIPSNKFLDLTLTGSMGDVMKESISVSLTNAWNLTNFERQKYLIENYNDTKNNIVYGIHIHCPDISTKKDGPSATTAFTVLIYSLLNDIKIKNYFGITGETHFGLLLTEIGGLQEKIIHSIKSGITEFIFPQENIKDYEKLLDKYKNNKILDGIKFHSIEHIDDVFNLILDK